MASRADCPQCGRNVALRGDGLFYKHSNDQGDPCPAFGQPIEKAKDPEGILDELTGGTQSGPGLMEPPVIKATFSIEARWADGQYHFEPAWVSENKRLCERRARDAGLTPVGEVKITDEWDAGRWHHSIYEIEVEP